MIDPSSDNLWYSHKLLTGSANIGVTSSSLLRGLGTTSAHYLGLRLVPCPQLIRPNGAVNTQSESRVSQYPRMSNRAVAVSQHCTAAVNTRVVRHRFGTRIIKSGLVRSAPECF